jgi:hypothetical protein
MNTMYKFSHQKILWGLQEKHTEGCKYYLLICIICAPSNNVNS